MRDVLENIIASFKNRRDMLRELNRLRKLVFYDELTGVLNRRGFMEEAQKAFRAVSFSRKHTERRAGLRIPFVVLFLDIDDFKKLNDTYGHDAGDRALKKVAALLKKNLRLQDIIGRLGGEEFVVALLGTRAETAHMVAERIRWDIHHGRFVAKGRRGIHVTASIGIAAHNGERDLNELIHNADEAMYRAKKKGKNRVIEFG